MAHLLLAFTVVTCNLKNSTYLNIFILIEVKPVASLFLASATLYNQL